MSSAEFQTHYDTKHVPMLQRLTGSAFPTSHVRRYIEREIFETTPEGATQRNSRTPAVVIWGKQSDFDYDVLAEMTFADQAAFGAFGAALNAPENAKELAAMEESFLDTTQNCAVVVGNVSETTA